MNCIDLMSKRSKMLRYVAKLQNNQITMNCIDLIDLTSKRSKTFELRRKTFKTTQNYKRNQITMNCIDLTSRTIKNVEVRRKTTKLIKLRMNCIDLTSKRSKLLSYVAKLQKWSNYNELHRFDVKTIKTFELGRKTTKVILFRWICIDLTSKRSKTLRYVNYKRDQITKTTQNYKTDQIKMNCIDLTSKRSKTFELRRKTFKTTLNYKSNQITINCIDLMSKRSRMMSYVAKHSKQRKTTKVFKLQWIDRFDVKNIKPTQNYKSDLLFRWISIDLTSKLSKHLS